jgi:acetyl-CoA carboxylase biotin carboxyl carrier protein
VELKEIKELIELVSEKGFTEFELQKGGFRLKMCLANNGAHSSVDSEDVEEISAPAPSPVIAKAEAKPAAKRSRTSEVSPSASSAQSVAAPPVELHKIKAPIVGTFYRSPSPTAEAFVKTGSNVKAGTVLCIIEAMKLMNEIEADVAGEIVEIYVENGQAVEYGQPLFGIKKAE